MGIGRIRPIFDNDNFQYVLDIEFQLYSFKEYITITQEVVNKKILRKIDDYDKFLKESSDEEIKWMYDIEDHEIKIFTHQLYYNSIFISLYSFLEKKMYQLCKLGEKKQLIKVKDLSGDGIVKYYNYFRKVLLINLQDLNTEWSSITKYNKLRNQLVHSPTNIIENSNNPSLIIILKSIKNLNIIDREDFVEYEITDKKLLLDFWSVINKFLSEIYYERM